MNAIKTIKFKAPLYRANKNIFIKLPNGTESKSYNASLAKINNLASIDYKNAPVKYFTLKRNNVKSYTKEGETYTKNWEVTKELNLVDILDLGTRKALETQDKYENENKQMKFIETINKAFPIFDGKVGRVSSSTKKDNRILNKICELGYDGYYMNVEGKNMGFHSEVGLCNKAFNKLKLMKKPEWKYARNTLKRKRNYNNNNNNDDNNNQFKARKERAKLRMSHNPIPKFSLL